MAAHPVPSYHYLEFDSRQVPVECHNASLASSPNKPGENQGYYNTSVASVQNTDGFTSAQPQGTTLPAPVIYALPIEGGRVEVFIHVYGNTKYVGVRYIDEQGSILRADAFSMRLDNFVAPPHVSAAQHVETPIPGNMHAIPTTAPNHGQFAGNNYAQNWQTNANEHFPHYFYQNNAHTNH